MRLGPGERERAETVNVPVLGLDRGAWAPPSTAFEPAGTSAGFLVTAGVVVRETELAGTSCAELLATGDLLLTPGRERALLPDEPSWRALTPARVAVLDRRVLRTAGRLPAFAEALLARAAERAERLAVHQAIVQLPRVDLRVLALLWHLAERTGRVGPEGVILPLPLTHELVGRLIGARRPTVSLAVKQLVRRGHLARYADGWQLSSSMPDLAAELPPGQGAEAAAPPDPVEELAARTRERLQRWHERPEAPAGLRD